MQISNDVLNVLENCRCEGNVLFLPNQRLDRKMYVSVNKVLEAAGGKWNKKQKGHVFTDDPSEVIESVILTGEIHVVNAKKEFQFFETPAWLAKEMVQAANIWPEEYVLEPSAGRAAIANAIHAIEPEAYLHCYELNPENRAYLENKGFTVIGSDFLQHTGRQYDKIIANPPFSKQQDIDHITKMIDVCKPGGRVISIASASVLFRENRKTVQFRELIEDMDGTIEKLPDGTFKESGTMVNTVMICVDKP
jgi:hypothetical protein